jgi:prepilin peptidase CpaA
MINYPVLLLIVSIATFYDVKLRKIPNALTLPAMAAGLTIQALTGGMAGLLSGVLGLLMGTGLFFIIYLIGAIGAGDAKLVGAVGAFVGPRGILVVTLLTALAGGLYALFFLLFYRSRTKGTLKSIKQIFMIFALTKKWELGPEGEDKNAPKLCYGVAIAAGTAAYVAINAAGLQMPV